MGSAVDHPPIRGPRLWITFLKEVALWALDLSAATTALRRSRGLLIDVTWLPEQAKSAFSARSGADCEQMMSPGITDESACYVII
jgi:hypothetical protein